MHRRDRSRGDGMDALIGERLEHGVYNLRLEFLQPFLRWSTLAFVLAFNFIIEPAAAAAAKTRSTTVLFCFSLSSVSGPESRGGRSLLLSTDGPLAGARKATMLDWPLTYLGPLNAYVLLTSGFSVRSRLLFFTAVYLVLELTAATQTGSRALSVHFFLASGVTFLRLQSLGCR